MASVVACGGNVLCKPVGLVGLNEELLSCYDRCVEKLAQQAVLLPQRLWREVSVAVLVGTLGLVRLWRVGRGVHVERREQQHGQEYCQQYAG